jgi:hypothetical protein
MGTRGVVAVTEIPSGAKSAPFNLSTISRKAELGKEKETCPLQVKARQLTFPLKLRLRIFDFKLATIV